MPLAAHPIEAPGPMLPPRLEIFPLAQVAELAEKLRQARDVGQQAGVAREPLRRVQAIRSELERSSRLANRSKQGGAYHAIAWRRAEAALKAIRGVRGLDPQTHEDLCSEAARILASVDRPV